ncbi:MAG: 3-phosphoshikimate 1-carboxyvinyltransferase [Sphingobacteriia bacterium]|nr:3-phosphoshikimate 1-carboxyvinyltransferase [Sphingobacteriia bacterium]
MKISGKVELPGSKSESNRALIIAALSKESISIEGLSTAEDTQVFLSFLEAAGYKLESFGTKLIIQKGISPQKPILVDIQQAGTALRFLPALAACLPLEVTFIGEDRLSQRPFYELGKALQSAGATIIFPSEFQSLPCKVTGNPNWKPAQFQLQSGMSSQLISALLLLAPNLPEGCEIHTDLKTIVSRPYLTMTLKMLFKLGFNWEEKSLGWKLSLIPQETSKILINGDWSGASYFLGLAATRKADILLYPLRLSGLQGDEQQIKIFEEWGLNITPEKEGIRVVNQIGNLVKPFTINLQDMPDLAPTFAVLALYSSGECKLTGLETLKLKESDRIEALRDNLMSLGAKVESSDSSLTIFPANPVILPAFLRTWSDHRMAMALSILMADYPDLILEDPSVVKKSFPDYWIQFQKLINPG